MEYIKGIFATIFSEVVVYFLIKFYESSNSYQYWNYIVPYFGKLIYVVFLIPIILVFVYYLKKRKNNSGSLIMSIPLGGYEDLPECYRYKGLDWVVQIPNRRYNFERMSARDIHVRYTPLCPKCGTEISSKKFSKLIYWSCIDPTCDYKNITLSSGSKMRDDVEKLCRRDFKKAQREYYSD